MSGRRRSRLAWVAAVVAAMALLGLAMGAAWAQPPTFELRIRQHRFEPAVLKVPAERMFRLVVHNDDPTPEQFESTGLKRGKLIPGNASATIFVAPLQPGTYDFFGQFNQATAQGRIIAR